MTEDQPLRVAAIQMPHGQTLDENLATASRMVAEARRAGARLALLPEYFFATFDGAPRAAHAEAVRRFLTDATRDGAIAVSGNAIEARGAGWANVGLVYAHGRPVLEQTKIHPMPRERQDDIHGGTTLDVALVAGQPTGLLVCSDILYPEAARILAIQGATILLNPVMSPYREEDLTRDAREALYVARAYDAGAFVIKAGGYHRGEPAVVGRSLIAAPWGLLARYRDGFTQEVLTADLDLQRLAAYRAHQATFPDRRPDIYRRLVEDPR